MISATCGRWVVTHWYAPRARCRQFAREPSSIRVANQKDNVPFSNSARNFFLLGDSFVNNVLDVTFLLLQFLMRHRSNSKQWWIYWNWIEKILFYSSLSNKLKYLVCILLIRKVLKNIDYFGVIVILCVYFLCYLWNSGVCLMCGLKGKLQEIVLKRKYYLFYCFIYFYY